MRDSTEQADGGASGAGVSEGTFGACFAKKGEFVARNIAGETILVPVRGRTGDLDAIFNLNEVAGYIWNRIDGGTTVGQLVAGVCSEFEVGPEEAQDDTLKFVAALQEAGLVALAAIAKD